MKVLNKLEFIDNAENATEALYEDIKAVAGKWYIPVLGELVVNPILGCTTALIGVAHMMAGIALTIFGGCYCIFNPKDGKNLMSIGAVVLLCGFLLGVATGLLLATPVLGAIVLEKTGREKSTLAP